MFAGGIGGATPWGVAMLLHFYKNGVLYETKSIWNLGAYGITLDYHLQGHLYYQYLLYYLKQS